MTKEQEIILLDKAIKAFGEWSYMGPFLRKHREELVWAIRNDLPIETGLKVDNGITR